MKQIQSALMALLVAGITFSACNKKDDNNTGTNNNGNGNNPPATVDSGKIYFHIHTYLEEEEVDGYNIAYTLENGRKISLSRAQFYVSGIQLIRPDGTLYPITGKILLKVLEDESYLVATVPAGTYKAVQFNIGLDAATNAMDAAANDVLNHSEMWFGSTAQPDGYIFLNAQGKIDTTADATGTAAQMQPFVYKIGTAAHYTQVTMPEHSPNFTVTKDATEFVHMLFDYTGLFSGLPLSDPASLSVSSKADNSSSLSNTIAKNIAGSFRYEE